MRLERLELNSDESGRVVRRTKRSPCRRGREGGLLNATVETISRFLKRAVS